MKLDIISPQALQGTFKLLEQVFPELQRTKVEPAINWYLSRRSPTKTQRQTLPEPDVVQPVWMVHSVRSVPSYRQFLASFGPTFKMPGSLQEEVLTLAAIALRVQGQSLDSKAATLLTERMGELKPLLVNQEVDKRPDKSVEALVKARETAVQVVDSLNKLRTSTIIA